MTEFVIVGASESELIGTVPDQSAMDLAVEPALAAFAQAGLRLRDVDGVATTLPPAEVAFELGLRVRWIDGTNVGGCSAIVHVRHAIAAIKAGLASVVLIAHGESGRSRVGAPPFAMNPDSLAGQYEFPYGASSTFTRLTLPAAAYLARYGFGEADLAEVPVAQSRWAEQNPRAARRKRLEVSDVLDSRLIAWPFRVLECCPLSDGGGAIVITTAERARDLDLQYAPVTVAGAAEATEGPGPWALESLTGYEAFGRSSSDALRQAGAALSDIDHLMIYDAYAHLPLYGLEEIGFAARGEAIDFIREGHVTPGGSLPMNTNGGGLLYAHTGMYGMFALMESILQLQGRAAAQVEGVRTSLVQGIGGMYNAAAAVVLQNERNFGVNETISLV